MKTQCLQETYLSAVGSDKRKYIAELFENDNEENKKKLFYQS